MIPAAIDIDLLRAFAVVCRAGSLSRAAPTLARTQSALSMQMRRLESLLGRPLLRRTGRGVVPTAEGEAFLGYALRILALGDEAAAKLRAPPLDGVVRIGLPEEIALATLPGTLGQLRRIHPHLRLEVRVGHTVTNAPLWQQRGLDLLVGSPAVVAAPALATWNVRLRWVCGRDDEPAPDAPLDLVVFDDPCVWRHRMFEALAHAGLDHRTGFLSPSVAAVQAAVENGLGVALLPPDLIHPATMRIMPSRPGLEESLTVQYGLYAHSDRSIQADAIASALLGALTGHGTGCPVS